MPYTMQISDDLKAKIEDLVITVFTNAIDTPGCAYAIAAIRSLSMLVGATTESAGFEAMTIMELQAIIQEGRKVLTEYSQEPSVSSGCALFLRFITRTGLEIPDFEECRQTLIDRASGFVSAAETSWRKISKLGSAFITDGVTVLVHGYSRVVHRVLHDAAVPNSTEFTLLVTQCGAADAKNDEQSAFNKYASDLSQYVKVKVVSDLSIGFMMDRVDAVMIGAEAVVETGGIINRTGTYQIAMLADRFDVPVYVAVEAYKFNKSYPLRQTDLTKLGLISQEVDGSYSSTSVAPQRDYTPPELITLLFTDLGALTPNAVSDELIKLYQ
ncbi:Initiation factor 2B-related [Carpediemonas membranifera]|uniref:Translation initiation factor eIF2B subunit alpha n=1 Tax=Carpediemonas membranifera TaxID=201153 RepID=A0A8J6APT0_9EUKA|nr:Initiation factor 2B-related [Carpediemonas membranifera]|eukprot:KAG9390406.1 Initiation factor 2B-related [Carpediemonas membranifera]